jgi:hypothetical protein
MPSIWNRPHQSEGPPGKVGTSPAPLARGDEARGVRRACVDGSAKVARCRVERQRAPGPTGRDRYEITSDQTRNILRQIVRARSSSRLRRVFWLLIRLPPRRRRAQRPLWHCCQPPSPTRIWCSSLGAHCGDGCSKDMAIQHANSGNRQATHRHRRIALGFCERLTLEASDYILENLNYGVGSIFQPGFIHFRRSV